MRTGIFGAAVLVVGTALLAACSGGMPQSGNRQSGGGMTPATQSQTTQSQAASGTASVLAMLTRQQTIGSAVNPVNGDVNPYG